MWPAVFSVITSALAIFSAGPVDLGPRHATETVEADDLSYGERA
jgi:hypothetical protein